MQSGVGAASPFPGRGGALGALLPDRARAAAAALAAGLQAERDRWLLWLPPLLGCGIAAFFALPAEPPVPVSIAVAALSVAAAVLAWRAGTRGSALGRGLLVGGAAALAGFALAHGRLESVQAPVLAREGTHEVTGRVAAAEPRGRGVRLLLEDVALSRLHPAETPLLVRVNLPRGGEELLPGDRVRVRARLQPPAPPALPGGFDYARQAYFERLGALGYSLGPPERVAGPPASGFDLAVASVRARIARRMAEVMPGTTGAVAAALIAGVRAAIDDDTWAAMQASGLAHILSISGLHMTMVAGTAFGLARFGLALVPWLALRVRVHKPAAVLAFAVSGGYFLLAGATVPTQRSFLMLGAALLAVLVDRNPFSLRVLAWAATAVLAIRPEALLGASFQLSFAAVLALMAVYEAVRLHREHDGRGGDTSERGPLARAAVYVLGVAATTVIAGAATAPFTAYHFQNVTTYGVLANLVAVPLTTFSVMPAGLLGLALMPFGLDAPAFALMGAGVDGMLWTARVVADLPGAALSLPQWPGATLGLVALGGLWLALWRRRWRLLGLAPLAVAGILAAVARPPDLLVDQSLGMAAHRLADGRVVLLEWERDARRRGGWLRALGVERGERGPVRGGERDGVGCDAAGCVVSLGGRTVGLARTAGAAAEDCGESVDLVLARAGPERCAAGDGAGRLIGPRALRASGGLAIRVPRGGGPLAVATVAASRGDWPWTRRPARVIAREINRE